MKKRINLYITVSVAMFIITLTLVTGCSPNVSGSGILSKDQIKGHDITTIKVTFFNAQNRLKSPIATLTSADQDKQTYIRDFRNIITKSKGITISSEDNFSPISDSSHYIEAIFDNDHKLDFYYSEENDWIIWSNVLDQDEQKIVEYHFLRSKVPMKEWLSAIKPMATINE